MKRPPPAPWLKDGRPDLWVRPSQFALLVNRSPDTVSLWAKNGTLRDFGYSFYRDLTGFLFIRIQESDAPALRRIWRNRRALRNQDNA